MVHDALDDAIQTVLLKYEVRLAREALAAWRAGYSHLLAVYFVSDGSNMVTNLGHNPAMLNAQFVPYNHEHAHVPPTADGGQVLDLSKLDDRETREPFEELLDDPQSWIEANRIKD